KIINIDKKKFTVALSTRPREMSTGKNSPIIRKKLDEDYDYEAERNYTPKKVEHKKAPTKGPTRVIPHPLFHQKTYIEAIEYLADKSNGSIVIRPSSKGFGHIGITWKLYNNIYQHIDVVEKDRDGASVGRRLEVENGRYVYSDLDELIVEYVEQKARMVDELTNHIKFRPSEENLKNFLDMSLNVNSKQSSYGFCLDSEIPGGFCLMFKFKQNSNIEIW
ncbi:15262_t:CDS:2, partial [Acaulospora morrowiae]